MSSGTRKNVRAPFALRDAAGHSKANARAKVLVWDSIDTNLNGVVYTWWERETVAEQLKVFRRVRLASVENLATSHHSNRAHHVGSMFAPP